MCWLFDLQEAQSALHVIGVSGRTDDVVPSTSTAEGPIVEQQVSLFLISQGLCLDLISDCSSSQF